MNPRFALALPCANPTLASPGQGVPVATVPPAASLGALSAGWFAEAPIPATNQMTWRGLVDSAGVGPVRRFQRLVVASGSGGRIYGPPSRYGMVPTTAGHGVCGALVNRRTPVVPAGQTNTVTVSLSCTLQNASRDVLERVSTATASGVTTDSDWQLDMGSGVPTFWGSPIAAVPDLLVSSTVQDGRFWNVDVALCALGMWSSAGGYFEMSNQLLAQGSAFGEVSPSSSGFGYPCAPGLLRDDLFVPRMKMTMAFTGLVEADRLAINTLYLRSMGGTYTLTDGEVCGGYNVLIMPNLVNWPLAMVGAFDHEPEWHLDGAYTEPARWGCSLSFTERPL